MFRTVPHCTHSSGICHTGLLTACEQDTPPAAEPNQFRPDPVRKLSANLYVLLCVQWKTADDVQRNCPKHVEFYSKNKFEKLVHLVGFNLRMQTDAWEPSLEQSFYKLWLENIITATLMEHKSNNMSTHPTAVYTSDPSTIRLSKDAHTTARLGAEHTPCLQNVLLCRKSLVLCIL